MSSPPEPPPTRQLFVRLLARRARDIQEVEDVFSPHGALKFCQLGPKHDFAFVHYWSTQDAINAKKNVDGALVFGLSLAVSFNRVSRLVRIDNYPPYLSREEVVSLIKEQLPRYQWIDTLSERRAAYIMMITENESIEAVKNLQGKQFGEWRWELEFHKESSHRPTTNAIYGQAPARALEPPAAASRSSPRATAEEVEKKKDEEIEKVRHDSPQRPESPRRSPPPRSSPPASVSHSSKKKKRGRSHSRSPSRSASSSPERSSSRKKDRRNSSSSRRRRRSPSSSSISRSPSPSSPSSEFDNSSKEGIFSHSCSKCKDHFNHLTRDHSKMTEDQVTKKLVKAWFKGNFEFYPTGESPRKSFITMRRQPFLKEYLNPFLRSVGLQPWGSRTPLYADWFLRKVLRLSRQERNSSCPWRFHRITSKSAFEGQLKKLLG